MSATDKFDNKAEELAGRAKEKLGEATDDEDKKNEGKADQVKANLKDAGEKVKDAFRD
ncbi:CsbD family protein [Nocardia sp. NBC_00416]|uniref:CsbD family protein n=1 Tax=Nocardia sp. NBC_00416 TaxID=2975991 RepID=UPI002E231418